MVVGGNGGSSDVDCMASILLYSYVSYGPSSVAAIETRIRIRIGEVRRSPWARIVMLFSIMLIHGK